MKVNFNYERARGVLTGLYLTHKARLPYVAGISVLLIIFLASKAMEKRTSVLHVQDKFSFDGGRVLDSGRGIYKRKEMVLSKSVKDLRDSNEDLQEQVKELEKKISEIGGGTPRPSDQTNESASKPDADPSAAPTPGPPQDSRQTQSQGAGFEVTAPPEELSAKIVRDRVGVTQASPMRSFRIPPRKGPAPKVGPTVLSFPVKAKEVDDGHGVVIPSGSFVKSKLMTGVQAPEGKTYPVLLSLEYAYIAPNDHRIDLTGCFLIVKSTGDLSTERVQMQAEKLSCVSKAGRMFEKPVNGFVADDKDNSFAVTGELNSKRDRVFLTALLSKVVEGIGSHARNAQTSQSTQYGNHLSGTQTNVTGDEMKYVAGGAAADSAAMVTQWYLKHAESLLPTIIVNSGQDVWVVMQDKVSLPNWYFQGNQGKQTSLFNYFTTVRDKKSAEAHPDVE